MIDLDLVPYIARLRDRVSDFREVGGAAELDAAMTGHVVPPAAFIVYRSGRAAPNELDDVGTHDQQITATLDVFICERNVADVFGAKAAAELRTLRIATFQALAGYTPDKAQLSPLNRTDDSLWRLDAGVLWWRLGFTTQFYMRFTPES